jgi:hypothetical protein
MLCVRHRRFAQGGLVLLIVVVWVERKANSNSQFNGLTDLTVLFSGRTITQLARKSARRTLESERHGQRQSLAYSHG